MVPAIVALLLAFFAASGGGVAYASQASLPGDTLYPVKTSLEQVQLAFALSDEAKAQAYLNLAERRLQELTKLAEKGRGERSREPAKQYEEYLAQALKWLEQSGERGKDIDELLERFQKNLERQQAVLAKVQQQVPDQAQDAIAQAMTVSKRGLEQASEAIKRREALQWKVQGLLQSITGNLWLVEDLTFVVDSRTRVAGRPPVVGAHVVAKGEILPDGSLLALKVEVGGGIPAKPPAPGPTKTPEPTRTPRSR